MNRFSHTSKHGRALPPPYRMVAPSIQNAPAPDDSRLRLIVDPTLPRILALPFERGEPPAQHLADAIGQSHRNAPKRHLRRPPGPTSGPRPKPPPGGS